MAHVHECPRSHPPWATALSTGIPWWQGLVLAPDRSIPTARLPDGWVAREEGGRFRQLSGSGAFATAASHADPGPAVASGSPCAHGRWPLCSLPSQDTGSAIVWVQNTRKTGRAATFCHQRASLPRGSGEAGTEGPRWDRDDDDGDGHAAAGGSRVVTRAGLLVRWLGTLLRAASGKPVFKQTERKGNEDSTTGGGTSRA
ncbi:hypothetical protein D623_10008156 [Myotis brandtii]|uniref:Uncharacterized protein n=1 Tax=Myotis brandtii TaxID=109478 RepID=S7QAD9_MYOBR|nr:hypothetical protein D623_10008156 [Myotis brandtii]